MSQVSRPVQIALVAVLVLGALWFLALRPRQQSGSGTPTPAPAPAPAPAASASAPAASPHSSLGGLGRAIDKANAAVATSNANANALGRASAAASSPNVAATGSAPAAGAAAPSTGTAVAPSAATHSSSPSATRSQSAAGTSAASATAARGTTAAAAGASPAVVIKNQLAAGKTVALLFWNPLASDDQAVKAALQALVTPHGTFVLHVATADHVVDYGSIVDVAQVLETPTVLLMRGKSVETITDLQDPSDLRQSVWDIQAGGPGEITEPKLAVYAPRTPRAVYLARANAYCAGKLSAAEQNVLTLRSLSLSAAVSSAVARNEQVLAGLAAITPPAADRSYLHAIFTAELRSDKELVAAFSASPYEAHNLVLSSEANDDLAAGLAKSYGLVGCLAPGAR